MTKVFTTFYRCPVCGVYALVRHGELKDGQEAPPPKNWRGRRMRYLDWEDGRTEKVLHCPDCASLTVEERVARTMETDIGELTDRWGHLLSDRRIRKLAEKPAWRYV